MSQIRQGSRSSNGEKPPQDFLLVSDITVEHRLIPGMHLGLFREEFCRSVADWYDPGTVWPKTRKAYLPFE